ncbi:MAG: hypothetical protein LW834_04360, partial [Cyanobium sp. 49614_E6]|nr:hypothetical protein [Cyanobium sp. 49614_E6]
PLWLLNISTGWPITVGIGVLHPVFTSATVVFYDHRTNHALGKMYFSDPRIHRGLPLPEGVVSMEEERERIEEAGGAMEPSPLLAPLFGKPWF